MYKLSYWPRTLKFFLFMWALCLFLTKSEKIVSLSKYQTGLLRNYFINICSAAACVSVSTKNVAKASGGPASWFRIASTGLDSWYNPYNQRIFDTKRNSFLPSRPEFFLKKELGNRKVVIIGEVHSNPCHHRVEFEIVRTLYNADTSTNDSNNNPNSNVAIGMEAFYRQHQPMLDDFVFKHKNFDILQRDTNWVETWGYDLNYYSKILRYASEHNIRVIGLNVPQPIAHYVSQVGLQNVPAKLKKLLPADIDLTNKKHRRQFDENIMAAAIQSNHGVMKGASMQRLYDAQCLWDEYMAETVANYVNTHPQQTLVVIAGAGHVRGRTGLPDRIKKRLINSNNNNNNAATADNSSSSSLDPFVIVSQQVDWLADVEEAGQGQGLPDIEVPLKLEDCDWAWYTEKEIVTS